MSTLLIEYLSVHFPTLPSRRFTRPCFRPSFVTHTSLGCYGIALVEFLPGEVLLPPYYIRSFSLLNLIFFHLSFNRRTAAGN